MAIGDRLVGRAHLRRVCRTPETVKVAVGDRFVQWIDAGPRAPAAVVEEVQQMVLRRLEQAERVGRRRGTMVGLALGAAIGAVLAVLATLASMIR